MAPKKKNDNNNDNTKICPRCSEQATKVCGGCNSISYCSTECQEADRHPHKLLCSSFKDFKKPPLPNMRRIVAFLPGESKPRFIWVAAKYDAEKGYEDFDFTDIVDVGKQAFIRSTVTRTNAWTRQDLGQDLKIYYDDNFAGNYEDENEAIRNATQSMAGLAWRGPVVVCCGQFGGDAFSLDADKLSDMDLEAHAHAVGFLVDWYNNTPQQAACKGPKVSCVRVACKGDREKGVPSHQAVLVPRSHPIFTGGGTPSEVSKVTLHRTHISGSCSNGDTNPRS
jgi:hypothetical protein